MRAECCERRSLTHQQLLARAIVDVAEWAYRVVEHGVSGGPAVRTEVADVEIVATTGGARRIRQVADPDIRVSFALQEGHVPLGAARAALEQRTQAPARHVGRHVEPGGVEDGRRQIGKRDDRVGHMAGTRHAGPRMTSGTRVPPS